MRLQALLTAVGRHPFISFFTFLGVILGFLAALITNSTAIVDFINKNPFISLLFLIVIVVVVVVIISTANFFDKRAVRKTIEGLTAGVNINIYLEKFGTPTFINVNGAIKSYIFVQNYFYLEATVDTNDVVACFAVTTRNKTFRPTFKSPGYPKSQPSFQITLGKSKFSDIPSTPNFILGWVGASYPFCYYETHYFGRPGLYQEFGFGLNCAGYLPDNIYKYLSVLQRTSQYSAGISAITEQELTNLTDLRNSTAFNTYAISVPGKTIKDFAERNLGVWNDQVRTLSH